MRLNISWQMAADGTAGVLTVTEYAEFMRAQPAGDDLDHF